MMKQDDDNAGVIFWNVLYNTYRPMDWLFLEVFSIFHVHVKAGTASEICFCKDRRIYTND